MMNLRLMTTRHSREDLRFIFRSADIEGGGKFGQFVNVLVELP
jgi:hypothetical protein